MSETAAPTLPASPTTDPERVKQLLDAMLPPLIDLLDYCIAQNIDWAARYEGALERILAARRSKPHPLREALQRTGEVYPAETLQQLMGVTRQVLYNWRKQRKILALRDKHDDFAYPQVQFIAAPHPDRPIALHPDLRMILQEGAMLTPTELFIFLATPQPALGNQTGWDLMHAGRSDEVVALLRHVRGGAPGGKGGDVVQDVPVDVDAAHDPSILEGADRGVPDPGISLMHTPSGAKV